MINHALFVRLEAKPRKEVVQSLEAGHRAASSGRRVFAKAAAFGFVLTAEKPKILNENP